MQKMIALMGLAFLLVGTPALADTTLQTTIYNYPNAPVKITACSASLDDTDVGNVDYYLRPKASYYNASSKDIKALELKFILMDGFDTIIGRKGGIDHDGLSAGNSDNGSWEYIAFPNTTSEVKCVLERVKFTDGTTWTN